VVGGENLGRWVYEQRAISCYLKVRVIRSHLRDPETFHDNKARAIGKRECLIMKLSLPFLGLPESLSPNSLHTHDL